ncbi:MAG TPA: site-2 protease family protein [Thermomicrobiales bacterium]|nr:site-2 protease family protein [Thermomicrobiales bacterium]
MFGLGSLDLTQIAIIIVSFIIAVTVHEFMHAWTAWKLGDDTARLLGRISLNPVDHFDPVGFLMFILIALGFPAIAWGKPVPVNTSGLRPLGRFGRHGSMALVSLAGPLSNVALGIAAALSLRLAAANPNSIPQLDYALMLFMQINFLLAAFNMIPIPPLDGSRILAAILPDFWRPLLAQLDRYGFMLLLLLILFGSVGGAILSGISGPPFALLMRLFAPA